MGNGGSTSSGGASKKQELHFMYIQMEYCDKQTLRSAIDEGLYKNTERVWRMFRVREHSLMTSRKRWSKKTE